MANEQRLGPPVTPNGERAPLEVIPTDYKFVQFLRNDMLLQCKNTLATTQLIILTCLML